MNLKTAIRITGAIGTTICGACIVNSIGIFSASAEQPELTADDDTLTKQVGINLSKLKLKQVQVFFRHGARTPLHLAPGFEEVSYPADFLLRDVPHTIFDHEIVILPDRRPRGDFSDFELHYKKTQLKGGGYAGNMTTYGQEQMYSLGRHLREIYVNQHKLITDEYHPDDVYVQSTNITRTIASARCVLAGLFNRASLNQYGSVQIPVLLTEGEILFPNTHMCSVLHKVNHSAMIHFDNIPGVKEDRLTVEKALGLNSSGKIEDKWNFVAIRDDFIARQAHGYNLPEKVQSVMDIIERNAVKIIYYAMCGRHDGERPTVTRLSIGLAMQMALEEMKKSLKGDKASKIYLYSTHDSTMVALLESLGLFDWKWPPFAADLRLELYQDQSGEHWVRVLYCDEEKTIRGCSSPVCKFEDFQRSLKPYTIDKEEYKKLCSSQILEDIAASMLAHDREELESPLIKERSEIPAGM